MVKSVFKRFASLLLIAAMALSCIGLFPQEIFADVLETPEISGLSASYTNGTWTATGRTLKGSAETDQVANCGETTYTPVESTLVLTNSSGDPAQISFSYEKPDLAVGGSVAIDGSYVTAAGSFMKDLGIGEGVTVTIVSGDATMPGVSSIQLENVSMTMKKRITTTFEMPVGSGSYEVNGIQITSAQSITQLSTDPYYLSASPAAGYKLEGWYSTEGNKFISTAAAFTAYFDADQSVYPVFIPSSVPVWEVEGKWYTDLNDALTYATSYNKSKITLVSDGILSAGTYTIPEGKTLLIPYDLEATVNTDFPGRVLAPAAAPPSAFRTLILESGADIVVDGDLCVNAKVNGNNTSYTGVTTGKYGYIKASEGSSITLGSGGNLYCWGFISGPGEIRALAGSKVYEPFQCSDIRGGSATVEMNNNSSKVLPFQQYYVQNIEAPLTIEYGATEVAVGSIYVSSVDVDETPAIDFIGNDPSSLFRLGSGTSFKKTYSPEEDRIYYDVSGDSSLNSVSLDVGVEVDTSKYVLPLMQNTTVRLHSGTMTLNQSVFMIPGFEMDIDQGAALDIAAEINVYVYDRDEYIGNGFVFKDTDLAVSYYQPGRAGGNEFSVDKMADTRIDVNGDIFISGSLYTTVSKADIVSSEGSGRITFIAAPTDTGVTYQATQDNNNSPIVEYTEIPVTAPQLRNGTFGMTTDPEYTATAGTPEGSYFSYCAKEDKWHEGDPCEMEYVLEGWTWAGDYSSAFAIFADEVGREQTVEAAVTSVTTLPDCETEGQTVYTAAVTFKGVSYTDTKSVIIGALGHDWDEPSYTWASDYSCTAFKVCLRDQSHKVSENAVVSSSVTLEPTDTEAGIMTYTAVFTDPDFETQYRNAEIPVKEVAYIAIQDVPKTEYTAGDELDVSGGALLVTYADGDTAVIAMTPEMVFGFDSFETGEHTLTVKYGDAETTYDISVAAGDIDVIPYGASVFHEGENYFIDKNTVTVVFDVPCRLGYYDNEQDLYIALEAKDNGDGSYSFTAPETVTEVILVIKGDADLSEEFDFFDVVLAKGIDLGKETDPTAIQLFAADVDGDGEFGFFDVILMKAADLGKTPFTW